MKTEDFKVHAVCAISNYGGWELQISDDGTMARVRINNGDGVSVPCAWRGVKHTADGDSYIVCLGYRLYLSNFIKV